MAEADDAFALLGLTSDATTADVRAARRELAKAHHPDQGGDPAVMQAVNEAADRALALVGRPADEPADDPTRASRSGPDAPQRRSDREPSWSGVATDVPSFTVEALPVETFEGLLIVASWIGEVLDDDPPYRLDTHLHEPVECWCRLDVVPDAGASTVSLTIAGVDGAPTPDIIAVRDLWIANLNAVDWS
jgi:hypothetical protein